LAHKGASKVNTEPNRSEKNKTAFGPNFDANIPPGILNKSQDDVINEIKA